MFFVSIGKSLPVHCVVEAVCSVAERSKRPAVVETDSYVIIPASTSFEDLVSVALARLGYTRDTAAAATGESEVRGQRGSEVRVLHARGSTVVTSTPCSTCVHVLNLFWNFLIFFNWW